MKRILFHDNSTNGKVGGSHHSLLLLVKNLNASKYQKVVVLGSDIALRPEFEKYSKVIIWNGLSVIYFAGLGAREGWNSKFSSLPATIAKPLNHCYRNGMVVYNDFLLGMKLIRDYFLLLKREKIHLLHLNNSFDPYWNVAAKLARVPVVQHIRGIGETFYSPLCHLSKKVICISDDIKRGVLARGINPKKVVRIYNAVDLSEFRPTRDAASLRAELGIPDSDPMISLFGNVQRWKGQDTLVKACARLRKKYPQIRCVLFGEIIQEDYAEELQQIADSEHLNDCYIFAGYKNNIADWMNCSDVVVHASVAPEPFGRVLIEAMAVGKPVIGTNIGAVPEIIDDKISGLLFEPGNDEQLAKYIDFLLSHPQEAARLGQNAVRRVRQVFDVKQHISTIENLYEGIFQSL